jgi:hypothetical protein
VISELFLPRREGAYAGEACEAEYILRSELRTLCFTASAALTRPQPGGHRLPEKTLPQFIAAGRLLA